MKKTALIMLTLFLFSCAGKPEVWRNIDTDLPTISIFIGSIKTGKHIARPGPERVCSDPPEVDVNGEEVICIIGHYDPPPMKLTIKLEEQIYGNHLGSQIFANTTSHFGLNSFDIGNGQKYLMIVLSDGVTNILPRYYFKPVNERYLGDFSENEINQLEPVERYALPLAEPTSEVNWLPCDTQVRENVIVKEGKVGLYSFYNQVKKDRDYDDELFYRKANLKALIEEHRHLIEADARYHFNRSVLYRRTDAL